MSLQSLAKIAKAVEKYMIDEVSVTRSAGSESVLNPVTLELTPVTTVVYTGKAMVSPEGGVYGANLGGANTSETRFEVGIPHDSPGVMPNDIVEVTSSANNPGMIGMKIVVTGQIDSTFFTHRRLTCIRREDATQ